MAQLKHPLVLAVLALIALILGTASTNADADDRTSSNKARSLANAPSLMEKARQRARSRQTRPVEPKMPDAESLRGLLRWAARLTARELPADLNPPRLQVLPAAQLRQRVCPERPQHCSSLVAAYGIHEEVILFSDELDMSDPVDRSYLLHELVHFLQHREEGAQVNRSCESILRWERHAYAAQSRYLARSGHSFPIDEMMKLSFCPS